MIISVTYQLPKYFFKLFFFFFFFFTSKVLIPLFWASCFIPYEYPAAVKSLQSCLTLCDPIDGSPWGYPVPGILQARTLEWVAISFSNTWKWKVKVKSLSCVRLLAAPWTEAHQAPPSMGFSRQEYWNRFPFPTPGNLSDPEIEPKSPVSPALQADSSPRRYLLLVHLEWTIMLEIMGSTLCLSFYFVGWGKPQWHHASRQWHWDWIAVVGQEKWTY